MTDIVPVTKDEDGERPIPTVWRKTLSDVVEAFKQGDYVLERGVTAVCRISPSEASRIAGNIENYGDSLISLPENTWKTSICQWQLDYWDLLVDLFTLDGPSDLVLYVRVFEDECEAHGYRFEVESVHVE